MVRKKNFYERKIFTRNAEKKKAAAKEARQIRKDAKAIPKKLLK